MTAIIIISSILAVFLVILLIGAAITYKMTFYRNPKKHKCNPYKYLDKGIYKNYADISRKLIDDAIAAPYESVFIKSYDKTPLHARYFHKADGAPLAILCHGYKSTPMLDFSGGYLMAMEFGFNVLMIDQRAHGESGGRTISFGGREKLDVISWIDYAKERFGGDVKIMLYGMSMGSATVLLAGGEALPENVIGIMADCPYSSAKDIINKVISDMGLPAKLFYPLIRLGAIIYGRFDPNKVDVIKAAKKIKVPAVIMHGEEDNFVPFTMSKKIAEESPVTLHTFPGADHGICALVDNERYKRVAKELVDKALSEKRSGRL